MCYFFFIINNSGDARLRDVRCQDKRKCIESHYKYLRANKTYKLWVLTHNLIWRQMWIFAVLSALMHRMLKTLLCSSKQVFRDLCELYSSWVRRSSHFMKSYPHMQNTYVHSILYLKWSKYVTYTFKEVMYFFILKKISVMLYVSLPCKKYFELLINLVNRLNSTGLQRLLKMWSSNLVLCKIFFLIIKSR